MAKQNRGVLSIQVCLSSLKNLKGETLQTWFNFQVRQCVIALKVWWKHPRVKRGRSCLPVGMPRLCYICQQVERLSKSRTRGINVKEEDVLLLRCDFFPSAKTQCNTQY